MLVAAVELLPFSHLLNCQATLEMLRAEIVFHLVEVVQPNWEALVVDELELEVSKVEVYPLGLMTQRWDLFELVTALHVGMSRVLPLLPREVLIE